VRGGGPEEKEGKHIERGMAEKKRGPEVCLGSAAPREKAHPAPTLPARVAPRKRCCTRPLALHHHTSHSTIPINDLFAALDHSSVELSV